MTYKRMLLGGAITVATILGGHAYAQDTRSGATSIEEVVVTARKREESLQSVPVAISAATGEQLEQQGIKQATDLSRTVPSLQVSAATSTGAAGAVITLRGQSMGDVLLTLSPAVGLYIDSANVPHPSGANISFYDLSRIEVLKGAQGTLYGRNTTGGAVNVLTRDADHNGYHGYIEGDVGNYQSLKFTAAANAPLVEDKLAARLAYQYWSRDSYGKSVVTGQDVGGDRDDQAFRLTVNMDPTNYLTAKLKFETAEANRSGLLYTIRDFSRSALAAPGVTFAATALNEERWYTGVAGGVAPWNLTSCANDNLFETCSGTISRDDVKTRHAVFDVSWDISDDITLRSISGYHWFEAFRVFDLDATPYIVSENGVPFDVGAARPPAGLLPDGTPRPQPPYAHPFELVPDQTSEQFTQELNLSGETWEGKFNWLIGAFYSFDSGRGAQLSVRQPATSTATSAANFFAPTMQAFEGFDLDISTAALFTQNDIKFSDVVSVTLGARYTEERMKQLNGAWIYDQNFEHANTALSGPGQNYQCLTGPFVAGPDYQLNRQACGIPQSVKYSGTSYLASLNLQFTPEILTYFRIARGFKGGALQWRAPTFPPVSPETAEDYEIGFKGDFFGRRLRTNLAIFQTNFTNQQLSTIVFLPGTNVRTTVLQNAADARIRGAELEFRVIPPVVEGLSIYGNVGYVDATYVDFAGALVTSGAVRNRSGEPFDIPEWTGNIGARYEMDLGPGRLGLQADAAYTGERPLTKTTQETIINVIPNLTERAAVRDTLLELREARTLVNARADYVMPDMGLTVSVWATNLLDKEYQIPSIDMTANFGLLTGITQEPRMYGVTVRKTFGAE